MSDELEEAVKRVRLCQAEGPDSAYPNAKGGEFHEDCLTITDAYLAESTELAHLRAENDRLLAAIAAEDAAHAWVQDAPQPETMCDYPECKDEGCPCQYWREPTPSSTPAPTAPENYFPHSPEFCIA